MARLDARTRNQVKLTLCGQFAFLARRPAAPRPPGTSPTN
jgi:hypothetical protein